MHYHCEIIMPKSTDISKDLTEILAPFSEHYEENENHSGVPFFDWWTIGGRFSGTKGMCAYDSSKIDLFHAELIKRKITVSGFQAGKQELSPVDQIPEVDGLWNEFFPTEDGSITPCPLFKHSNDQYDSNSLIECDISKVSEISNSLTCERVIFAGLNWDGTKREAEHMISKSLWNGVSHVESKWDGNVKTALDDFVEKIGRYSDEYKDKYTPRDDWICVTVDYHN